MGWIFGNLGLENTRPLRPCVYASIRQRFRTVQVTGYRSAQERAENLLKLMCFCNQNMMETTIGRFSYNKKSANVKR